MMKEKVTNAVIMAAGLGTRLQPFTHYTPKTLLPFFGIPLLQFSLDALRSYGIQHVVINIHHHAKEAEKMISRLDTSGLKVSLSHEDSLLLGSAGGIRQAASFFKDSNFLLLNGDLLCDDSLDELVSAHQQAKENFGVHMTLALLPGSRVGTPYREVLYHPATQLVEGLGDVRPHRSYFMGKAVIEPEAYSALPIGVAADFVPSILEPAFQKKKAAVFVTQGMDWDMGSPKLWWNAHLHWLHLLENNNAIQHTQDNATFRLWKKLIEKVNIQMGPYCWVSRKSKLPITNRVIPPCYLDLSSAGEYMGGSWGPQTVYYGDLSFIGSLEQGIGYAGEWVDCRGHEENPMGMLKNL